MTVVIIIVTVIIDLDIIFSFIDIFIVCEEMYFPGVNIARRKRKVKKIMITFLRIIFSFIEILLLFSSYVSHTKYHKIYHSNFPAHNRMQTYGIHIVLQIIFRTFSRSRLTRNIIFTYSKITFQNNFCRSEFIKCA